MCCTGVSTCALLLCAPQDPKNKRNILLDDRMRTVFVPPVNMFSMNKQLSRHIYTSGTRSSVASRVTQRAQRAAHADGSHASAHVVRPFEGAALHCFSLQMWLAWVVAAAAAAAVPSAAATMTATMTTTATTTGDRVPRRANVQNLAVPLVVAAVVALPSQCH